MAIIYKDIDDEPGFGLQHRSPRELLAEGWRFQNVPWMKRSNWDLLCEICGLSDVMVLTMVQPVESDLVRGSILVSPAGYDNMTSYHEQIVIKKQ